MKNETFETGAKSAEVNNLMLYIQTTRNLSEKREKIFKDWFNFGGYGTTPAMWVLSAFCDRSIAQYKKEFSEGIYLSKAEKYDVISILSAQYNEWKNENYGLRAVRVTYSNGEVVETSMAHGLTDQEIKEYFAVGKTFNIGSVADNLQTVTKCEILK